MLQPNVLCYQLGCLSLRSLTLVSLTHVGLTLKRRNKMASVCAHVSLVTLAARQIVARSVLSALNVPRQLRVSSRNAAIPARDCAALMRNAA